jgi:hypothetical protein
MPHDASLHGSASSQARLSRDPDTSLCLGWILSRGAGPEKTGRPENPAREQPSQHGLSKRITPGAGLRERNCPRPRGGGGGRRGAA